MEKEDALENQQANKKLPNHLFCKDIKRYYYWYETYYRSIFSAFNATLLSYYPNIDVTVILEYLLSQLESQYCQ